MLVDVAAAQESSCNGYVYDLMFHRSVMKLFGILFNLGIGIRIVDVFPSHGFDLLLQVLEYHEQSRYYEDLADHTDKHTAYGCCSQCTVSVCTYTHGEHEREQSEVIRMGRRRAAAPNTAAHVMLIPILRRSKANSTIRMAFLANRPISMINAICM